MLDQVIPNPLAKFGWDGLCGANGPLNLLTSVIQLITVVAGLWALINLLISGMQYISSQGNPEQLQQAWRRIILSLIGLVIVVGAFTIAAIIGQALFGDASFFLKPTIIGIGECR